MHAASQGGSGQDCGLTGGTFLLGTLNSSNSEESVVILGYQLTVCIDEAFFRKEDCNQTVLK